MTAPVLFLAGVPKAGTSSLFAWLAQHPEVTPARCKETRFFADPGSHVFRPDFNAGRGHAIDDAFPTPRPGTRLRLEGTPTTIYARTALEHLPGLPGARCLFVLRDPAEQIRSLHGYFRDNWSYVPADMDFAAYLAAVRAGGHAFGGNELAADPLPRADYLPWLEAWRARMGPDRMRVVTFDRLRADPLKLLREVARWCDLSPEPLDDLSTASENETYAPRSRAIQRINVALRARLPKGPAYRAARSLYRRLNTRAPDRSGDAAAMEALRAEFAPANRRLAESFGLDLAAWMPR
ncbi:sulfotransferase [Jannaschia sp. W003]|uniref:sulfotransferase family protein n=1 Tax=Jannaschia sp. W003 TaxID=2867012 RepID=UPI0021A45044|nr:sulfotransferase [Jannaschia sp. W003]UWQ23195.1 sulfotransferase [Jannaschia sp. W003]